MVERHTELEMLRNGSREKAQQIAAQVRRDLEAQSPIGDTTVDKAIVALQRSAEYFAASEQYERQRIEELNRANGVR